MEYPEWGESVINPVEAESVYGLACFVDVETTGLSPQSDEIVELALCLFEFSWKTGEITRVVERYTGLREPGVPISSGAARVHGINPADLQGKCLDHERIETMLHKAAFIIAHNASFDRGFTGRISQVWHGKLWLCSMNGIDWRSKGFASRGLQSLLKDHGIKVSRSHRAQDDVSAAVELLSHPGKDGRSYFFELLQRYPRLQKALDKKR